MGVHAAQRGYLPFDDRLQDASLFQKSGEALLGLLQLHCANWQQSSHPLVKLSYKARSVLIRMIFSKTERNIPVT